MVQASAVTWVLFFFRGFFPSIAFCLGLDEGDRETGQDRQVACLFFHLLFGVSWLLLLRWPFWKWAHCPGLFALLAYLSGSWCSLLSPQHMQKVIDEYLKWDLTSCKDRNSILWVQLPVPDHSFRLPKWFSYQVCLMLKCHEFSVGYNFFCYVSCF